MSHVAERVDISAESRRDYRAFMRSGNASAVLETVEDAFRSWLTRKGIALDERGAGNTRDGREAAASMYALEDGQHGLVQCKLAEGGGESEVWSTDLLASSEGWLQLSVGSSQGTYAGVPNIAKELMRRLDLRDANLELRDEVRMWDVAELDQLVELLLSPDRNGLVLVAGTGPDPTLFDAYRDRLPKWIGEAYGLAQMISLTPQATLGLEKRLEGHAPQPWTIRTYYPGLRLGSESDARRHRYLTVGTLATQSDHRISKLLGNVARNYAATRDVPLEVVEARRLFVRADAQRTLNRLATVAERATEPPPTPPSSGAPDFGSTGVVSPEDLDSVRGLLGVDTLTASSVAKVIDELRREIPESVQGELQSTEDLVYEQISRIEELEDANRGLMAISEDDELNRADMLDELDSLRARVKWLQVKLNEAEDFESPFAAVPAEYLTEYPASCEDLVLGLQEGDVIFTGDLGEVRDVDQADSFQACVREATRCVSSLREYVRARRDGKASSGVHHFLSHLPEGYDGVSVGKHAQGESGYTRTRYGNERVFPVPASVTETGYVLMIAHFKLAQIGRFSPRMHYFDDTAGSGRVYIGYLGRHLTNRHTN